MRFLIADDDVACRELMLDILSHYGDCDCATNGAEATDAYEEALNSGVGYDAVLLDIMMPDMDGQQALNAIRSIELKQGLCGSDRAVVIMV